MKKLIWILVLAVMVLSSNAFAEKETTYTYVDFVIKKTPNVKKNIDGVIWYRPWTIVLRGWGCTPAGGTSPEITIRTTDGELSETRLTGEQLRTYQVHEAEKQIMADFYLRALEEDITQ